MKTASSLPFISELLRDLRAYVVVCEDILGLAEREHQALCAAMVYESFEFFRGRKDLLVRLDQSLINLRDWRRRWQQADPGERANQREVKTLFQMLQDLIVKILQLDRENQQALLRRGLVPAQNLPSPASQQPNYVANLYRRHSGS